MLNFRKMKNYKWQIDQLDTIGEGYVINVHAIRICTEDTEGGECYEVGAPVCLTFDYNEGDVPKIPYQELTKEVVESWLNARFILNHELAQIIEEQKNPTVIQQKTFPWQS